MSTRLFTLLAASLLAACASSRSDREGKASSGDQAEFGEASSPIVQTRLQARVENIRYQRGVTLITNLERIAAYGEIAIPVCLEGLKNEDAMTRMGCAWVLGRIGDTRTVPDLEGALSDEVDFVRFEAASQLCGLGARSGYRTLVDGLEHEKVEYRYKCFEALRDTTGHSFGYSHNAAPEIRAVAVTKWREWLEQVEAEDV